jgi:predicted MFS family arabinose efflux permease
MSSELLESAADAPETDGIKPLTGAYSRYALSLLLAISIVNYLDRQVVHILAEPIKRDLHLADWQIGMLTGLAFGVLYTFLGLPIARMAEHGDRPRIIAAAGAVWSVFTLVCALAANFVQLGLARVGVGVGEAGCTPPAHSLIMDYAPPKKRSSALAFYGLGPPLGGLLGLAFGGLVADAYGWRAAFLVAGLPGLLFALLAAVTLKEPRRGLARRGAKARAAASLGEMFRLIRGKRSYWLLGAAMVLNVFIALGFAPFIASFYLRNHAAELAAMARTGGAAFGFRLGPVGLLGLALGLLSGIGGALGTWIGGQLSDRFGPAEPRWYLYIPAAAVLLSAPAFLGLLFAPSVAVSLACFGLYYLIGFTWYGPAFTAWFGLVPPHMRATNSALSLFVSNLFGLGLAPLGVGLLSDTLGARLGSGDGLRWALASLTSVALITAWLFWRAARTFREEMEI